MSLLKYELLWKSLHFDLTSYVFRTNIRNIYINNKLFDKEDSSKKLENEQNTSKIESENLAENKRNEAANKMMELLLSMKKDDFKDETSNVRLSKPREFARAQHNQDLINQEKKEEEAKKKDLGNQLSEAASEVAKSYGGDVHKTEMELLDILLSKKTKSQVEEPIDEPAPVEQQTKVPSEQQEDPINLGNLIAGMKIDMTLESSVPLEQTRAYQIRKMLIKKSGKEDELENFFISRRPSKTYSSQPRSKIDLFGETPLGIFNAKELEEKSSDPTVLPVWSLMSTRELRLSVTHPPSNIYELMIQWTEQGKLWRFPIDNEQDWHDEKKIDFTAHVFLEGHLEPWCPTTGPIRNFMELVCVGLSKNPYLTVAEKIEHIIWYEEYFRSKNDVLERAEAGTIKDREPLAELQQ